ncbi:nitrite/sulfite reductase [Clostridium thermobutyricum]|uniref:nitrite/sulfite reductase n=1 Tax=Clostridium thermobutyricum TaxID=29372 RepID=UPI0018A99373|nr:nitrite/sulfite reductase [Clostridium thermobutyricum]
MKKQLISNELKEVLREEIRVFRENGHKFLNKELTVPQFKSLSGGMGSYAHRGGKEFMIRLKTPSGVISKEDFNQIYDWAVKYKREWIHPTTREAIQFHGMTIDEVCDLMEEALDYGIYSRGSGGNFPRNVAISPLAGVSKNEAFDVRPYAEKVNEYIMNRVNQYKLPRKIKVAMSSDRVAEPHSTTTDLGFIAVKENGKDMFKLFIGGGLGRNPRKGVEFPELVDPMEVVYYFEALVRLFVAEGDYENHGKARIRYIVERMGEKEFIACYKKHLKEVKDSEDLSFTFEPKTITKAGIKTSTIDNRLIEQKQEGLYAVYFHPEKGILETKLLGELLELTNEMEEVSFRITMNEGLYIINLNGAEADKVLEFTKGKGGELKVMQSVSCIGVPICQLGIGNSQGLVSSIIDKLKAEKIEKDLLPIIHVSGCANSCGVHEIGQIGFTGKTKRVNDAPRKCFELHVGGKFELGNTELGDIYGDMLEEEIPNFIYDLYKVLAKENKAFEAWYKDNNDSFKELANKYLV